MANQVLSQITQPMIKNPSTFNDNFPLSYKEWLNGSVGVSPTEAFQQYEQYLTDFYKRNTETNIERKNKIKENYFEFVKKISSFFPNDPVLKRFQNINFDNKLELKLLIPFVADKLKEIALYYSSLRNKIKNTKIQYATIGSETGLERFLYSKLMESFQSNLPLINTSQNFTDDEKNDISKNFKIEVEELYEIENPFYDNRLDINPLFCIFENLLYNFCENSDINRKYLKNDNIIVDNDICDTNIEFIDSNILYSQATNKYIGNDIFFLSGGQLENVKFSNTLNFQEGNNFFYWFSGESVNEIKDGIFKDISIHDIDWSSATAGQTINDSDIIFITYGNLRTDGAWFMSADEVAFAAELTATMQNNKEFKFPYPGFGLSAEGSLWSGPSLSDIEEFDKRFFPSETAIQNVENEVKNLYWFSSFSSLTSMNPISIHKLNLIEEAKSSPYFSDADKIIRRVTNNPNRLNDSNPDEIYNNRFEIAWLYQHNHTQLPIVEGSNNIFFPITATSETDFSDIFNYSSIPSIPLSSVKVNQSFIGAVAGDDINNSDFIIQKASPCGPDLDGAWLSGPSLNSLRSDDPADCFCDTTYKYIAATGPIFQKGVMQPSLSFKCEPGKLIKFIWTGPTTKLNNIIGFTGFDHDDTCTYHKHDIDEIDYTSLNYKNLNLEEAEKWKTCNCKSVHHSPLGLKEGLDQSQELLDYILEIDDPLDTTINLLNWRGTDGKNYLNSDKSSHFILTKTANNTIGWGKGYWKNNIELKTGHMYAFARSNINQCLFDLPSFFINQCYEEFITFCDKVSNIPRWKKAIRNSDGEWIKTDEDSDMILDSKFVYEYDHKPSYKFDISKIEVNGKKDFDDLFITVNRLKDTVVTHTASYSNNSTGFVINIPLESLKYWATASYDDAEMTQNQKIFRGYDDNRVIADNIILNQPFPSSMMIGYSDVIRYETPCNHCFIWKQPLTLLKKEEIRRWNKIDFTERGKSDILDYLHFNCLNIEAGNECLSENFVQKSLKTSYISTNNPSDIIFNTELSGVPLFINYVAKSPTSITFEIEDLVNKKKTDVNITQIVSAIAPWKNLINDEFASFVFDNAQTPLFSEKDLGLFLPKFLGIGKYELRNAESIQTSFSGNFRKDNYFDGPFEAKNINSEWQKHIDGVPYIKKNQTYYPYQSKNNELGLYDKNSLLSPFSRKLILNDLNIPAFCENYDSFDNIIELSGNITDWEIDVFQNQFFIIDSHLYVKINGEIYHAEESLGDIFSSYFTLSF